MVPCDNHRSFSQHKVQFTAVVTSLQNGLFFSFSSVIEIFIDVEHYPENNISFIWHDLAKEFSNPHRTSNRIVDWLQTVPS